MLLGGFWSLFFRFWELDFYIVLCVGFTLTLSVLCGLVVGSFC